METFTTVTVLIPPGGAVFWFSTWWDILDPGNWVAAYEKNQIKITLPWDDIDALMERLLAASFLDCRWTYVLVPQSLDNQLVRVIPHSWQEEPFCMPETSGEIGTLYFNAILPRPVRRP
jgi:hypothetical protein